MARSAANDPLEKFRFIMSWSEGTSSEPTALVRAGFHDVQMPKRTTTKGTYREGNDIDVPQVFPGLSSMEDVVLSRGVISAVATNFAAATELYRWMSAVHKPGTGIAGYVGAGTSTSAPAAARGLNSYRTEITISMLDRQGAVVRRWRLYQAWPTNFTPGSDLNAAEDGDKSMESLTLCFEDFQELSAPAGAAITF